MAKDTEAKLSLGLLSVLVGGSATLVSQLLIYSTTINNKDKHTVFIQRPLQRHFCQYYKCGMGYS